jgi:NADH-quinone oxidoreductase subunit L
MLSLFPANDYALIAVILGLPLLGAFVNGIWGRRLGKPAVKLMALAAVGGSFLASVVAFVGLAQFVNAQKDAHVKLAWNVWQWMHTTGDSGVNVPIDVKFSIDQLSGVMMLIVTGVGFLIHLYATSYMQDDEGYARFFSYLNLFIFSMLVLILGDNLPLLFVGWEGVGLCSYLLIGFWYKSAANAAAGKKAFIANRIGDFGLLCAMFLLAHYASALDWDGLSRHATNLVDPTFGGSSETARVHIWPLGGGKYEGALAFLQPGWFQAHHVPILQSIFPAKAVTISAATAVALALLLGCTGKSAQLPLYTWLPDAMAGPTPVSALIHAATMVTAGIYLICRMSFVFVLSPFAMSVVAVVGAVTALLAATIALVQNDIKKVLAYSTVSQLGFMFLGVGVGAFTAGFFHVFTHAFFKACLFLCAGSVIHAMHARVHDQDKAQDIRNMGGLARWLPLTRWTFLASTAAIIGVPFTSGFFSKDEILYRSYIDHMVNPVVTKGAWEPPAQLGTILYGMALAAAVMTAFYMVRLYILTFHGEFRGWTIGRPSLLAREELAGGHDAAHAGSDEDDDEHDDHGDEAHGHTDLTQPGYPPHESPWPMTVPLIILAAFSLLAGLFINPGFHIMHDPPLEHWLHPVFASATESAVKVAQGTEQVGFELRLAVGGIAAFLIGTGLAYWMYVSRKGEPAKQLAEAQPRLYKLLLDKWRVDEFYDATAIAAVDSLAETSAAFDRSFVDGIIARFTALVVAAAGTVLRAFQNGVVHVYAAMMVVGLAGLGWFFIAPHPDATSVVSGGDVVVTAAPGVGYSYEWDTDGSGKFGGLTADGKFKPDEFDTNGQTKVHVDPAKALTTLSNPSGFWFTSSFTVANAAEIKKDTRIRIVPPNGESRDGSDFDVTDVSGNTITVARTRFGEAFGAFPTGSEVRTGPAKVQLRARNSFGLVQTATIWVERPAGAPQEVGQN